MEKSTSLHIIIEVKMFKIKSAVKQISLMLAIPAKKKKAVDIHCLFFGENYR